MAMLRREDSGEGGSIQVPQTHTLLGPESSFEGKLTFQGAERIDGKFAGEIITDNTLIIGEGANVKAEIHVGSLILNGTIEGNVFAKSAVEIRAPGVLRGNLTTPSLTIDRGVVFEGSCHMENLDRQASAMSKAAKASEPQEKPPALPESDKNKK